MRKCIVHYYEVNGETRWKCPNSLMSSSSTHSMDRDTCWLASCPGRKPNYPICKWKDCTQRVAPNKLNHCSETCRKKDNRYAYKQRQKAKKDNEFAVDKVLQTQVKEPKGDICHWKDCNKKVAPNKLRHCSERCRKRDNQYAYRLRQQEKKLNA